MSELDMLSDKGKEEFFELINIFKNEMRTVSERVLGDLYVNVLPYIESDSWINYREKLRLELQNKYIKEETCTSEDAWAMFVRESIFVQYRDQLEQGLIKDLQKRIKFLETSLEERYRFY